MSDTNIDIGGDPGDHSEALAALERLDAEIGAAGTAATLDRADLCAQYHRLKPLLATAIKLVQAIPIYGPRIANAIRFLMTLADQVCPS